MTTTICKSRKHPILSGVALAIAALFAALFLFGVLSSPDKVGFAVFVFLISFVFAALGAWLARYQNGVEILGDKDAIVVWKRAGGKKIENRIPCAELDHLKIFSKSVTNSYRWSERRTTTVVYPVCAVSKAGDESPILATVDYSKARRDAERLARVAGLSLHDHTATPPTIRSHDNLDETLQARLLRERAEVELPAAPKGCGLELDERAGKALISLPKPGLIGMMGALVMLFLGVPFSILVAGVSRQDDMVFLAVAGPIILVSAAIIWNALIPREIEIDHARLVVRQTGGLRRKLGEIKLADLEEVVDRAGNLFCRGDHRDIIIPLKDNGQARWVKQAIDLSLRRCLY